MDAPETSTSGDLRKETVRDNVNVRDADNDNEDRISVIERGGSERGGAAPNRMTFQLVLPQPQTVNDDPQGFGTVNAGRRSRPVSRTGSVIESKSPGFINTRLVNYNRGLSHQPSIISGRTHQTNAEAHHPPPSTDLEKSKHTKHYFSTIFSIMYSLFLMTFGAIVFIAEGFEPSFVWPVSQIFVIYMMSIGIVYFIFLYVDIRIHINKAKKAAKQREEQLQRYEEQMMRIEETFQSTLELRRTANGDLNVQIPVPEMGIGPVKPISHRYCFATGRHGEFLYLKLGAAWFCFGLLIHSVLLISYQIMYFTYDVSCIDPVQLAADILFPIHSLIVVFFFFKFINVIINVYRGIARWLFMHAFGSTLAMWVLIIVRETVDAIRLKNLGDGNGNGNGDGIEAEDNLFVEVRVERMHGGVPISPRSVVCPSPDDLNTVRATISPYLYPFVIEFCILISGIFYMIWANVNKCPKKLAARSHGHGHGHDDHNGSGQHGGSHTHLTAIREEDHGNKPNGGLHRATSMRSVSSEHCGNVDHENDYKSYISVHVDCHASSRGFLAGLILMILKIVFIILLHLAVHNPDYATIGIMIDRIFALVVMIILIIVVIVAYFQTSKLDVNLHPISRLDDVLLFVAIPAFFSETIFSFVPAIINGSAVNILNIIAQLTQILIQTPWIIDALRRCTNSVHLKKKKPGRELVTFMTIANVALWIYLTFSVRTGDTQDERYTFYGYELWSILNHMSLPLIMFYRFHASVCLVDIWRHSYEPGEFAH